MIEAVEILVAGVACVLLVGSWGFVVWRRWSLLQRYRDRRARTAFMVGLTVLATALALAGQQAISVLLDGGIDGLRLQLLLVGMGIGALTWGGIIEALYLRGR